VDQRGIFVRRKSEKVQGQLAQGQGRAHPEVDDILIVAVGQQAEEGAGGKRTGMRAAAGSGELNGPLKFVTNAAPYLFDEASLSRAVERIRELAG